MVVWHEQGQFWGGTSNPRASLRATLEAQEQWFGLYYQGRKIGFSQTMLVPEEHEGMPGVSIVDRGRLSFNLLGAPQQLEVSARAFIDANWRLQTFTAAIHTATDQLTWTGRRQGDELLVTVTTMDSTVTKRLRDPTGGAFINGLSSWVVFHRLHVGQAGKSWVLNPLALTPELVTFQVQRTDILDGTQVLVVETSASGITTTSWVTPEGKVLKETSPLGWELRQESRTQAMEEPAQRSPTLDLLSATAVPIDQRLDDVAQIDRLILLIEGAGANAFGIQRPWQQVLPPEQLDAYHRATPPGPWCLLQLSRPVRRPANPSILDSVRPYQQPSLFVQSDDARILAKAAAIVGTRTDPWEQVEALTHWVYVTLVKRLTVGLPSAVDVLNTPLGDCHEHTVLFTALARSRKIPTRMVAGLVYWDGQFYYHAWPEVWVGQWIPVDPTLGQSIADVTHLGLSEAENERLVTLSQFVGRLRVQVLDVYRAGS